MPTPIDNLLRRTSYSRASLGQFDRYLADQKAINLQRFADYLTVGGDTGFYLVVNDEILLKQMEALTGARVMYLATIEAAKKAFIPQCNPILNDILIEAADAQEDGAFPDRFKEPMFRAVKHLPPPSITGNAPHLVTVTLPNLYDHLGDEDHYSAAFHHGALLEGGRTTNNGPFFSEARANIRERIFNEGDLKTKSASKRYLYWKALSEGKSTIRLNRGTEFTDEFGLSGSVDVPLAGSWAETQQARLDAWRRAKPNGAPQWLLLEYGQPRWKPTIKLATQYGVVTKIRSGGGSRRIAVLRGGGLTAGGTNTLRGGSASIQTGPYIPGNISRAWVIPGNISGAWVAALSAEWTKIVAGVWAQQVEAFNRTPTAQKISFFDIKSNRLRSPITGRYMAKSQAFNLLPTRSSRTVQPFPDKPPIVPFRNSPISDYEAWEGTLEDILDEDF